MGANAQTSVPTFSAGEILTAANMNISARTGVPVFADSTARDAAFGGTGEKTLAEGQLAYLENSNVVQYYDGASWATVGPAAASGLTFITGATFSTVTSFSLPANTFSATYKNYKVFIAVTDATADVDTTVRLRASGTDNTSASYQTMLTGITNGGTASNSTSSGATSFLFGETDGTASAIYTSFDILAPQISTQSTVLMGNLYFIDKPVTANVGRSGVWVFASFEGFDSLSFISSVASSITGYYHVYGYSES